MTRIAVIYGTRPEGIKMAPVIHALNAHKNLEVIACTTGQHRQILDQVMKIFGIKPDIDLDIMTQNQTLIDIHVAVLQGLAKAFQDRPKPDLVLVHGDTTTSFAAAHWAYYNQIAIGHVESGLRTYNKYAPFPEEMNRRLTAPLTDFHFAPTEHSKKNLLAERIPEEQVYVTGNTVVDALKMILAEMKAKGDDTLPFQLKPGEPFVLMTAHRRENFGRPLERIFATLVDLCQQHPEIKVVYPVHPNPNVSGPAQKWLSKVSNILLVPPVEYHELLLLMQHCQFVLTDSGGIQEEAPALGKPVLVLRVTTERPEVIDAGAGKLVGSDEALIRSSFTALLDSQSSLYQTMSCSRELYGDGQAAQRIAQICADAGKKNKAEP